MRVFAPPCAAGKYMWATAQQMAFFTIVLVFLAAFLFFLGGGVQKVSLLYSGPSTLENCHTSLPVWTRLVKFRTTDCQPGAQFAS